MFVKAFVLALCVSCVLCAMSPHKRGAITRQTDASTGKQDISGDVKIVSTELKAGCIPRPSGNGCTCTELDIDGNERNISKKTDQDCRIDAVVPMRQRRDIKQTPIVHTEHVYAAIANEHPADIDVRVAAAGGAAETDDSARKPRQLSPSSVYKPNSPGAAPAMGADATAREAGMGAASGGAPARPSVEHQHNVERRDVGVQPRERPMGADGDERTAVGHHPNNKAASHGFDQNVRDPVREKAQQNYQAVLNELKEKFRGLKEGCFPRPKGCLCVIGKDVDGRDRTERRMKDADCKCASGDHSPGCPADGA